MELIPGQVPDTVVHDVKLEDVFADQEEASENASDFRWQGFRVGCHLNYKHVNGPHPKWCFSFWFPFNPPHPPPQTGANKTKTDPNTKGSSITFRHAHISCLPDLGKGCNKSAAKSIFFFFFFFLNLFSCFSLFSPTIGVRSWESVHGTPFMRIGAPRDGFLVESLQKQPTGGSRLFPPNTALSPCW